MSDARQNLIIGEGERCGLPLSAPMVEYDNKLALTGEIRWEKRETHFVLQQFTGLKWRDVGVHVPVAGKTLCQVFAEETAKECVHCHGTGIEEGGEICGCQFPQRETP